MLMECQCLFNAMSVALVIPGRRKGTKERHNIKINTDEMSVFI